MDRNDSLVALHRQLIALHDTLLDSLNQVDDPNAKQAILGELFEVSFRITTVGQQVFKRKTAEMEDALDQVAEAETELQEAIARIEEINNFITAITRFLGLVDMVVDIAKMV